MLTVKTYLGPDLHGGIGLFAAEDIPAGGLVWEWNDASERVFTREQIGLLPPIFRTFLSRYGYGFEDIPGSLVLSCDDGRFMNHSDNPNTTESPPTVIRANRDIKVGEELTCDYRVFDHELAGGGHFLKQHSATESA